MARVAIIGAGPAGCAAAISAARAGETVDLFERGNAGKDKPCGDALLPGAVHELRQLGIPPEAMADEACSFDRVALWNEDRQIWTLPLGTRRGLVARRATVDQALRDRARMAVQIHYQSRVRRVDWTGSHWLVTFGETSVAYDAVVLATGATNAIARQFRVDGQPTISASVSCYARRPGIVAPLFQFAPLSLNGYAWVFPLADDWVNIGVCAIDLAETSLQARATDLLSRWQVTEPGPMRGGAGPLWSDQGTSWHDQRGLLACGDAAGLVDPLTGEGIGPALESGRIAGTAIAAFLHAGGDAEPLEAYSIWVKRTFHQRYALNASRRIWAYLNEATRAPLLQ